MGETKQDRLAKGLLEGLLATTSLYVEEDDGRLVFRGERPGPEWHAHGLFARMLWTLIAGRLVRITVHKQRWRHVKTGKTCHSRPPDDLASVWFCSLVVVIALWGWVSGDAGVHRHERVAEAVALRPSPRTLQRWLSRALEHADETAMAVRRALLERSEPQPRDSYAGGERSPPKRWGGSRAVSTLHECLSLLYEGAVALDVHISTLLAEARRRQHVRSQGWLI